MIESLLTMTGNVVAEPDHKIVGNGVAFTRFRVASTQRRFDRTAGEWRDGPTTYLSVTCWRRLAEHAAECLHRGDPVVVVGRLFGRSYESDGQGRYVHELEATAIGHDLGRVRTEVRRSGGADVGGGPGAAGPGAAGPGATGAHDADARPAA